MNSDTPGYDNYIKEMKYKYHEFLKEQIKNNPLLNDYYNNQLSQAKMAEKYNVSASKISQLIKYEKEALRIKCIENGYTSRMVLRNRKASKECQYAESMIVKNGILKTVYILENDPEDIAEVLEIDVKSVEYAIDNAIREKEQILNGLKIENAKACLKAIKKYFPKQLMDVENMDLNYFKIINAVINSNEILIEYFQKDKRKTEIAEELNKSHEYINIRIKYGKAKIIELYNEYKKTNNIKAVPISENLLIKEKIQDLENIGIVKKDVYVRFTTYYFPELLEKIDSMPKQYFEFIDNFVNSNEIYKRYFVLGEKQVNIAKELNVSRQYISYKLLESKKTINKENTITKR